MTKLTEEQIHDIALTNLKDYFPNRTVKKGTVFDHVYLGAFKAGYHSRDEEVKELEIKLNGVTQDHEMICEYAEELKSQIDTLKAQNELMEDEGNFNKLDFTKTLAMIDEALKKVE